MRFEVSHFTHYSYDRPVFLDPHILRLRPRSDGTQQLHKFDMIITPQPAGHSDGIDAEDNSFTQVWFENTTTELIIETHFQIETLHINPFDFLIVENALPKPQAIHSDISPVVQAYSESVAREAGGEVISFLTLLTRRLAAEIRYEKRQNGFPHPSEVTLSGGVGACRDIAVLFMDCCRVFGIPARFVSGYTERPLNGDKPELHAWAEVYLAGGWRGFDPSSGFVVADRHIAVAGASTPAAIAPVSGTFRANGAQSRLETQISINKLGGA